MDDLFGEKVQNNCPVIKKGRQKLSAAQSEFNRLNKKIVALRDDIRELPEREKFIKTFFDEHVARLFDEEKTITFQWLDRLDAIYEGGVKLTKKEKELLSEFILKKLEVLNAFDLSDEQQQRVDMLDNKYLDISSGMTKEERDLDAVNVGLRFCSLMGVELSEKMKNAKTEAEFNDALEEQMRKEIEKEVQKMEEESKKAPSGPKAKKMSRYELKQKLQEEQTLKSIREIYIELVKELHPDKESDETKRQLKEERMKQLTEAYQAKDLALLLRMQVEWIEESAVSPETQTDEVLRRYNKVLRSQLKHLEDEYSLLCQSPFPGVLGIYGDCRKFKLKDLESKLSYILRNHTSDLEEMKLEVKSFSTARGTKASLKEFGKKLAENPFGEDLFDDIFKMLMGL